MPFPFRFKWGDINYDSTPGIGTFSYADYQYFSRNFEMLYCPAKAKELGGIIQTSPSKSTKDAGSKFFGSTVLLLIFVKILNSRAQRTS